MPWRVFVAGLSLLTLPVGKALLIAYANADAYNYANKSSSIILGMLTGCACTAKAVSFGMRSILAVLSLLRPRGSGKLTFSLRSVKVSASRCPKLASSTFENNRPLIQWRRLMRQHTYLLERFLLHWRRRHSYTRSVFPV